MGLSFFRWLTGAENLHYVPWPGSEVTAVNLRAAQEAYSERLFALLPQGRTPGVLDFGGGAGETAPGARLRETTFAAFETEARFERAPVSTGHLGTRRRHVPEHVLMSELEIITDGGHRAAPRSGRA